MYSSVLPEENGLMACVIFEKKKNAVVKVESNIYPKTMSELFFEELHQWPTLNLSYQP